MGAQLEGVPWPEEVKRDMLRWRNDPKKYYLGTGSRRATA